MHHNVNEMRSADVTEFLDSIFKRKDAIINKLKDFPYSRDEYWVITGSAMVLYGIREQTHDIDMGCTSAMADKIKARVMRA